MPATARPLPRLLFAFLALLAEAVHLAWELQQGGIASHHLLQRADLPAVSNAWGLLVLPALAAWTAGCWTALRPQWLLGFLLPAYRRESLLGFVLGMSWTFGAVLPLIVGGVIALLSWLFRTALRTGWRRLRPV